MKNLLLYTTQGCHLCEIAMQLLAATLSPEQYRIKAVEISESDQLVETYGIRIPVVADPDGNAELGWPFDQQQLLDFVADL